MNTIEFSNLQLVIKWFIKLRWIACAGVFITLLVFSSLLHIELHYKILFTTNFILFSANLSYSIYLIKIKKTVLTDREKKRFLHLQIISDYILLIVLVFFTGYLENPLIYYLIFHIMLTSFLFTERILIIYTSAAVLTIIFLSLLQINNIIAYFPLVSGGNTLDYFRRIPFRTGGIGTVLIICAYLISSIKDRINWRGELCQVELSRYKSLDKVKSNFILQVTHELRGPLAAVMGYHEILLKGLMGEIPEKSRMILTKANRRTDNLLTMIGEMIDFAYMKSEKEILYDDKNISLYDLLKENISLISENAEKKKIEVILNCPKNILIKTNRDLMNMIIGNLLTNGVKYSRMNGIISVICSREKEEIHLIVSDKGIGIQENELENIFEEFYRTRNARSLEKDGTGLGLAIVQRAVNSLQGRISVFSQFGEGTQFHIYIPDKKIA